MNETKNEVISGNEKNTEKELSIRSLPISIKVEEDILTTKKILLLTAFSFGNQFTFFLININVLPVHLDIIMGNNDVGKGNAIVGFSSAIPLVLFSVICGSLNDNFTSRFGKRNPWIIIGSLLQLLCLWTLWSSNSILGYTIGYTGFMCFSAVSSVPYSGLINDVCPPSQNGKISAFVGGMGLVGSIFGAATGIFSDQLQTVGLYIVITVVLMSTSIITSLQKEPLHHYTKTTKLKKFDTLKFFTNDFFEPLKKFDFLCLFFSRFFFQITGLTITSYFQLWIKDCTNSNLSSQTAVSLAMLPLLLVATVTSFFIPRTRRKIVVYVSSILMISAIIMMIFSTSFLSSFFITALFGAGAGPFQSVEFAMLLDILPNDETAARDISIWHNAFLLPQIFAAPIAGLIRDYFQIVGTENKIQCLGYKVVWSTCILYIFVGLVFTRVIKGIK
ncbi:hypothetical protein HDU92_008575 [Lobulomyces angularis]|nr:hypothetical protein HDU92_008575 [Lobulomyces angularis]